MKPGQIIAIYAALAISAGFTVGALACEDGPQHSAAQTLNLGASGPPAPEALAPETVMPEAYLLQTSYGEPEAAAYCREFQTEALIGGAPHMLYGTACRRPDGSWALVTGGPFVNADADEQLAVLNR